MDFNNPDAAVSRSREVNEGLRKHMNTIYARMSAGVFFTALVALAVGSSDTLLKLFLGGPQAYIIMLAPLAVVMFGFRPEAMKASTLKIVFFLLAALYGISFSAIAAASLGSTAFAHDVALAFFIASSMFAGLSIIGYTTKKDLSGMRTFLSMGIIGIVVLGLANLFIQSTMMSNLIAGAGILLFSGLTVWQTQDMKRMYSPNTPAELASRYAWAAALNLYISFIAMFQQILHFLQQR